MTITAAYSARTLVRIRKAYITCPRMISSSVVAVRGFYPSQIYAVEANPVRVTFYHIT